MSIKVESITKTYHTQKALDKVTFSIEPGEIVGLLGPNGAGKSTIMKIITGFLQPDSGEVSVDGKKVTGNTLDIRRKIGYLPENNPLYLDLYIAEYLEYVAGIYHLDKIHSRVNEIISLTGLEKERHKKIGALSKGYRQRVGIAQALIHDPSVLILDEPTSGLDPSQIVEIRELIRHISQSKTVMLSTHLMQEAEALCSRIIILNHGRIITSDTPTNIKSGERNQNQKILIEFAESIDQRLFSSIDGIVKIEPLTDKTWLIISNHPDLRPALFRFAIENQLTLLTLSKQESSLENVFLDLVR